MVCAGVSSHVIVLVDFDSTQVHMPPNDVLVQYASGSGSGVDDEHASAPPTPASTSNTTEKFRIDCSLAASLRRRPWASVEFARPYAGRPALAESGPRRAHQSSGRSSAEAGAAGAADAIRGGCSGVRSPGFAVTIAFIMRIDQMKEMTRYQT